MDDFVLLGDDIVNFLGLFSDSWQLSARSPGAGGHGLCFIDRAGIIMTELNEHIISRFQLIDEVAPCSLRDERAAACPSYSAVANVYQLQVKIGREQDPPAIAGGGGGIAGNKKRGQFWIAWGERGCGMERAAS